MDVLKKYKRKGSNIVALSLKKLIELGFEQLTKGKVQCNDVICLTKEQDLWIQIVDKWSKFDPKVTVVYRKNG